MMRASRRGLVFVLIAAGGCEAVGTERAPLGAVNQQPDAGASSSVGGGSGNSGSGGRGTTGPTAPPPPDDAGAPATGTSDPTCWDSQLPAVPQPILPVSTPAASCQAAATATDWSYTQDPAGTKADDRAKIIGRWVNCGTSGILGASQAGIEFGANGRWRSLVADANGNLAPIAPGTAGASGNYYLLGTGQLNVTLEDLMGAGTFRAAFSVGGDALRLSHPGGGDAQSSMRATVPP